MWDDADTHYQAQSSAGSKSAKHGCRMGLEGIVSKRPDTPYRSGPSRTWVKAKNPESAAVRREREEELR